MWSRWGGKKSFSLGFVFISLSCIPNLALISSFWLTWLHLSFSVSSFYYPDAAALQCKPRPLWLEFWSKVFASAERRLSEEIKLSPLKVRRSFHATAAIINMQWHMHTSRMIRDTASWIINFPKVPFAHCILSRHHNTHESQGAWRSKCKEARRETKTSCRSPTFLHAWMISSGFVAVTGRLAPLVLNVKCGTCCLMQFRCEWGNGA